MGENALKATTVGCGTSYGNTSHGSVKTRLQVSIHLVIARGSFVSIRDFSLERERGLFMVSAATVTRKACTIR
jgi:hypothetical protein